jgi:antibiotic biosynthesis monooxygenase (ABM) superfamily enzyme
MFCRHFGLQAPFASGIVMSPMNSNLNTALQALPAIVYVLVSILFLVLAVSWLVLPWTISGKLSEILNIQERQLRELERLNPKG